MTRSQVGTMRAPATRPSALSGAGASVSLRSITKRFPLRRTWRELLLAPLGRAPSISAVHDVSFDVAPGECFGVLGPNGAGKTTLFRMIAAAMPPDEGSLRVAGTEIRAGEAPRRLRGAVSSVMANDRTLYWRLSARENLFLFAALHGLRGVAARERVDELLHVVGLHDTGTRMSGEFSTGMRQRLLIARALLPRPAVLLLDEPTRSLDPVAARDFRAFLRDQVLRDAGCTVLVATHSDEDAFGLCDRVAFLDRGRLLALGRIDEVVGRFAESVVELSTRTPEHPVFTWLKAQGNVRGVERTTGDLDGWTTLRLTVAGDRDASADVLDLITAAGVRVGSFALVPPSLADLIQRIRTHTAAGAPC